MNLWRVHVEWRGNELIFTARVRSVSLAATVQVAIDALEAVTTNAPAFDLTTIRFSVDRG